MGRKLNVGSFILMSCLFFSVQAAADQEPAPRRNGLHIDDQQIRILLRESLIQLFTEDELLKAELGAFIYEALDMDGIDRAAGASFGDMYQGIIDRLVQGQVTSVKLQETLDSLVIEIRQLQDSSNRQEGKLDQVLQHFEQATTDRANLNIGLEKCIHLLDEGAKSLSLLIGLTETLRKKQEVVEKNLLADGSAITGLQGNYDGQEARLLQVEGDMAHVKGCLEFLKKEGTKLDPSVC